MSVILNQLNERGRMVNGIGSSVLGNPLVLRSARHCMDIILPGPYVSVVRFVSPGSLGISVTST